MAKKQIKGSATTIITPRAFYFQKAQTSTESKQLKELSEWALQEGLVEPPYPGEALLTLLESNPVFSACVRQIARDVAGLGWQLQLREGEKDSSVNRDKITTFIKDMNPNQPFRTLVKELLEDWGALGYFGIEVVRNNANVISQLYRVPAHTLRIHESKTKFCQIRNEKKVWFKLFGAEGNISSKTGKVGDFGADNANELIYYRNSYQKSDYYGIPNIISAIGDLVGLISSRDYNITFFTNHGMPDEVIILKGDWEPSTKETLKKFMATEHKGVENAHKALILTQPEGCEVSFNPIDTREVKDSSFQRYERDRRENILVAYSMPPERIGIRVVGELGGNVAKEATKIYKSGVIDPLQEDIENIVNMLINKLEVKEYDFKFNDIDLRDTESLIDRLVKEVAVGIISPNEARNELGKEPYEGGDVRYTSSGLVPITEPNEELQKSIQEFMTHGQVKSNT